MPTMARQEPYYRTIQRRRNIYTELSQLFVKLVRHSQEPLTQDELRVFNIQCSAMALRPEEGSNDGPSFCKLVSPGTMNKAFDSAFTSDYDLDWPGYNPEFRPSFYTARSIGMTLSDYTTSGRYSHEPLVDTEWYTVVDYSKALSLHEYNYPNLFKQWGIRAIRKLDNTQQPHVACLHFDDALTEDGLHASEVASAIKVMRQGMRLDKRGQFLIYPVYVYSFFNHQGRILEIYYDAGTLFVKKTPILDFVEENRENIKLYLRWMMNKPCGVPSLAREKDPDNVSDTSSD